MVVAQLLSPPLGRRRFRSSGPLSYLVGLQADWAKMTPVSKINKQINKCKAELVIPVLSGRLRLEDY